jgi:hypothetical protein
LAEISPEELGNLHSDDLLFIWNHLHGELKGERSDEKEVLFDIICKFNAENNRAKLNLHSKYNDFFEPLPRERHCDIIENVLQMMDKADMDIDEMHVMSPHIASSFNDSNGKAFQYKAAPVLAWELVYHLKCVYGLHLLPMVKDSYDLEDAIVEDLNSALDNHSLPKYPAQAAKLRRFFLKFKCNRISEYSDYDAVLESVLTQFKTFNLMKEDAVIADVEKLKVDSINKLINDNSLSDEDKTSLKEVCSKLKFFEYYSTEDSNEAEFNAMKIISDLREEATDAQTRSIFPKVANGNSLRKNIEDIKSKLDEGVLAMHPKEERQLRRYLEHFKIGKAKKVSYQENKSLKNITSNLPLPRLVNRKKGKVTATNDQNNTPVPIIADLNDEVLSKPFNIAENC